MSNTIDTINKLKNDYGLHLIPLKNKLPESKRIGVDDTGKPIYSWKYKDADHKEYLEYTDNELINNDIGCNHEASRTFAIDFDSKESVLFADLLPPTLEVSSVKDGETQVRQKIYRVSKDVQPEHKSWPNKNTVHHSEEGTVIEELSKTQSWLDGGNRFISNDIQPKELDLFEYQQIRRTVKKIYALSILKKYYPKKGQRDSFRLTLAGMLHFETNWSDPEKQLFVKKLCKAAGDEEVSKFVEKLRRVKRNIEKNIKDGNDPTKGIWSTKHLSELLGKPGIEGGLDFVDAIRSEERQKMLDAKSLGEVDKVHATGLSFLNGNEFCAKDFPEPDYILQPILASSQIRQVWAKAGTGKTLYCLYEAAAVVSGYDFLHYKHNGTKTPVLYVEGEMDSSSIKNRIFKIEEAYERQNKILNKDYLFFATLAIQKDMYFHSLTADVGRKNVEITAKEIERIIGKKPIIYLDNITALTVMQEKEGEQWVELMQWTSRMRNKGYHITFLHHPTKTGESASGSNIKERSIDIDMKLETPDEKTEIEEYGEDHTQMHIEFPKWREHNNTFHSKKRTAVISRNTGEWFIFPNLTKTQRTIWKKIKDGLSPIEIIDPVKEGLSKANVYKTIKILKAEGLLDDDYEKKSNEKEDIC